MKKIKKIVSLICIFAIFVSTLSTSSNAQYFTDLPANTAAYIREAVNYVSDHGIMTGVDTNVFGFGDNMTRAQAVFVLYKYSRDTGTYSNTFSDVLYGSWYYNAVGWAQSNQIVTGTSGSLFSPNANVTREAFMVMLYAYASAYGHPTDYIGNLIGNYYDGYSVSSWAANAVAWALAYGILPFDNSNYLSPQGVLLRQFGALSIHRYALKLDRGKIGRDNYGFTNGNTTLVNNSRYMTNADYTRINQYIDSNFSGYGIQFYKNSLNDFLQETGLCCYGLSITAMLDKIGILGVPKNFYSSINYLGDITSPSLQLISMINVYQFSQQFPEFTDCFTIDSNHCSEFLIQNRLNSVTNDMFVLGLSYYKSGSIANHTVLITNWWKENGVYNFIGFDPDKNTKYCYIHFDDSFSNAQYGHNGETNVYSISSIRFKSNSFVSDYRNLYDYDGILNCNVQGPLLINPNAQSSGNFDYDLERLNRIELNFNNDFTLINKEGKQISYINGVFSNDMKIYREGFIEDSNRYVFYVDDSDSYTITKDSDYMYFSISGKEYQIIYNGSGNTVQFGKGQEVRVSECKSNKFTLKYLIDDQVVTICGKTDSDLHSSISNGYLIINGCEDSCEIVKTEISSQKVIFEKELKPGGEIKVQ